MDSNTPHAVGGDLTSLPMEILTEIFTNLDYFTLKRSVSRTCRLFRAVIMDASSNNRRGELSRILFADDGSTPVSNYDELMSHPCLEYLRFSNIPAFKKLDLDIQSRGQDITIPLWLVGVYSRSGRFMALDTTAVANENATSPGANRVYFTTTYIKNTPLRPFEPQSISGRVYGVAHGHDGGSATVLDVLKAYVDKMEENKLGMHHVAKFHYTGSTWSGSYRFCTGTKVGRWTERSFRTQMPAIHLQVSYIPQTSQDHHGLF